jgi:hypothetical protein
MHRDLATSSEVNAARSVEDPGKLREPVAIAPRRYGRELVAEVLRE